MTIIPDSGGNFLGRERAPAALLIMALWETYEDCGFSEGDRISCHIPNYSMSAISINHVIVKSAISISRIIIISACFCCEPAPLLLLRLFSFFLLFFALSAQFYICVSESQ